MLITMTFKRIITIGLSLLLSLISACGFGNTKMKAELFFEPEMQLLLKSILKNDLQTAKKLILLFWKKKEVPTVVLWITDLTETLDLERIHFFLKNKLGEFDEI